MAPSVLAFVAFVLSHKQAVGVSFHKSGEKNQGI